MGVDLIAIQKCGKHKAGSTFRDTNSNGKALVALGKARYATRALVSDLQPGVPQEQFGSLVPAVSNAAIVEIENPNPDLNQSEIPGADEVQAQDETVKTQELFGEQDASIVSVENVQPASEVVHEQAPIIDTESQAEDVKNSVEPIEKTEKVAPKKPAKSHYKKSN